MKPSGTLLGSWQRSNRNLWIRLVIFVVGLFICMFNVVSGGFLSLFMGIAFLLFFILDLRRLFFNQERIFDLYSDGFIMKDHDENELCAYRWNEIVNATWPLRDQSNRSSHMSSSSSGDGCAGIIISLVIEITMTLIMNAIIFAVNTRRAKHSLRILAKDRKIHLESSYENADEMVKLVRETAVAAWVNEINTHLKQGQSVALDDRLSITHDGLQRNGEVLAWGQITDVTPSVDQDKITIVGKDADGKQQTYNYGSGLKAIALNTIIKQLRPLQTDKTAESAA